VRGREVIIPAFTCPVAVLGAVIESGGIPVFVDINLKNLNFDLHDLRQKITKSTAAIISHHYFGMTNPEVGINEHIARKHCLVHIEDCAHSLGAQFQGCPVGKIGDLAVYSFSKNMISPGGGLLQCNSDGLLDKVQTLYNQNSADRITRLLANFEFIIFFYQLLVIKRLFESVNARFKPDFLLYRIPHLLYLPFRFVKFFFKSQYYHGSFYETKRDDLSKNFPAFDIRMTGFQKFIIHGRIRLLHQMNTKRRKIAERFNRIVPHFFLQENDQHFVYTNYVFCTHVKCKMLSLAKEANILFDEAWPAEGRYWKEQNTKNVEKLKREVLLLSISPYWSEREIQRIENFLYNNKTLFLKPLDQYLLDS
jgi:dTDP-4-amino-4,6-dideoxygalactose transaminase